jgi:flagellar biosynthesis protein FliQ
MTEKLPTLATASEQFFGSLGRVSGLFAGIASVAYFVGWRYSVIYWNHFHAPWVLDLLSSGQMLVDAGRLIWPMVWGAFLSVLGALTGTRERTLSRWFRALLILAGLAMAVQWIPESIVRGSISRLLYELAPMSFMAAEGVGIGLLVWWFRQSNLTWTNHIADHLRWLFIVIVGTLPWIAADARAGLDAHEATSLLQAVSWPDQPEGDWRLGRAVDKGFIVIKLTSDPDVTEVRLLPFAANVLIRPINQPIM